MRLVEENQSDILLGLDIVKKLDITVVFGSDHFMAGQGKLAMMTYNEKHHWVFPLFPTACDYAKLDAYFGELQNRKWGYCKRRGIFWPIWKFGNGPEPKIECRKAKWEIRNDCFGHERFNSEYFCAVGECSFAKRGVEFEVEN